MDITLTVSPLIHKMNEWSISMPLFYAPLLNCNEETLILCEVAWKRYALWKVVELKCIAVTNRKRRQLMRQWIMRWIQCFDVIVRRASDVLFCTKPMRAALSVTDGCLSHQRASMYLHSLSRGRIRSAELLMTANELLSLMLKERSVNHRLRNAVDNSHLWFTWSCLMHEPALGGHITE